MTIQMNALYLNLHMAYLFFKILLNEICKLTRNLPLASFGSERVNGCDHKPAIIFFGFIALKTEILTFAIVLAGKLVKRYSFRCLLAKKYLFPVSLTTLQYD